VVIVLADTSAQPHAMVIEFEDAIIAFMAMRCPRWPEYLAYLTIFEFEESIALSVQAIIKYLVIPINVLIFSGDFLFLYRPVPPRDNSWI
jgi:hypothetical protein